MAVCVFIYIYVCVAFAKYAEENTCDNLERQEKNIRLAAPTAQACPGPGGTGTWC